MYLIYKPVSVCVQLLYSNSISVPFSLSYFLLYTGAPKYRYLIKTASLEKKNIYWLVIACNSIVSLCHKIEKSLRDEC